MHAASRWQGVDSRQLAREFAAHSEQPILNFLGTPPAPVREYLPVASVGSAPLRFAPQPAAPDGASTRHVLLVVTDADSGKPIQAAGC